MDAWRAEAESAKQQYEQYGTTLNQKLLHINNQVGSKQCLIFINVLHFFYSLQTTANLIIYKSCVVRNRSRTLVCHKNCSDFFLKVKSQISAGKSERRKQIVGKPMLRIGDALGKCKEHYGSLK